MDCRRCFECEGEEHHYVEPEPVVFEDGDGEPEPGFVCRHCGHTAYALECGECGAFLPLEALGTINAGSDLFCVECRLELAPYEE